MPWSSVGPGWTLAQYAGGAQATHATTLYLISPGGTKYTMHTWHASKTSNAGGVVRQLSVPGTKPGNGCMPVRWWDTRTILAYCIGKSYDLARLWLVPDNGATPTALTPVRTPVSHDLGDLGAWRLTSGLYLQSANACWDVNKQAANGSITPVTVHGTTGAQNLVVTADGPRLLIAGQSGCAEGASLVWFNPGTRAEQWLLRGPAGSYVIAVAYNSTENAPRR